MTNFLWLLLACFVVVVVGALCCVLFLWWCAFVDVCGRDAPYYPEDTDESL